MEGFLDVYNGVLKGWKNRYFQLSGQILTYYNSSSQKELGKIHMSVATVQNTSNSNQFTIKTGSKTISIKASSLDLKIKWLDALEISMQASNLKDQQLQMFTQILKSDQKIQQDKKQINKILDSDKLDQISQAIGNLSYKEVRLKEQFQDFLVKSTPNQKKHIQVLSKMMSELRKEIYNCLTEMEEEKKNLFFVKNSFEKKIPDLKLLNSEFIRKQLQTQIEDEENIESQNSSETLYESFSGQSEIEKAQRSFILANNKIDQTIQAIPEPQKQQMHQHTKLLLENNQVYEKFPLTQQSNQREQIPAFRDPNATMPVWEFFKKFIGKDVTKITMPVYFNMPISLLQKTVEFVEYLDVFKKANEEKNKSLQCGYILSIFFIVYSNTIGNPKKPFNPLLGETYEYIDSNLGFKLICEQVSHHPPIAAYYGESEFFKIEGFINLKISLSLKGIVAYDLGETIITLKSTNEKFTIKKPKTSVHNMIIGKMYVWIQGEMYCKNLDNDHQAILYVKPKGWTSSCDYEAEGKIVNDKNQTTFLLNGKWNEFLDAINAETQEVIKLVTKKEWPENRQEQYHFSKWMINANNLCQQQVCQLPPTDTRFRTDQRAYEHGDINLAASEKNRLEDQQRQRRKLRQKEGQKYNPFWFDFQINEDKIVQCKFKNGYWKCKDSLKWPEDIPNLFNQNQKKKLQRNLKQKLFIQFKLLKQNYTKNYN